jgi:hypothetical protein
MEEAERYTPEEFEEKMSAAKAVERGWCLLLLFAQRVGF